MKAAGAELIVKALQRAGVRFLFGIPGTHNIELYDALREAAGIETVLITDEQSSAFMADGVARASGALAAVNLVPGAGLTHALSGIAECFLDQVPLLVLVCGIRKDTGRAYQLHDVDQAAIVRPVSKGVFQPATHAELYEAVLAACALARQAPRGPAVVEVPAELYLFRGEAHEGADQPASAPAEVPPGELEAVAAALNGAKAVGIYVGLGALEGRDALLELAERLDAIVFTTVSGKGVFPESHPRWAWNVLGRGAPAGLRRLAEGCDCLLAIGCRFGEVATASFGLAQPPKLIHVDVDPSVFDRNVRAALKVQADAAAFLRGLLGCGKLKARAADAVRLGALRAAHEAVRRDQAAPGQPGRVRPSVLFEAVQRICGPETVFVADSGNGLFLAMEHLRLDRARAFLGPVDYSCMGYSVPAAIGAKLASPDRPVAAFVGDGAFLMTGLEMLTAAGQGAGVLFFLLRDRELSQIAQFQRIALGRQTCTTLGAYDAGTLAGGLGVASFSLERDEDVEDRVRQAYERSLQGHPVLVDVAIDYSKPTCFSQGVVATNFLRLPWPDRIRVVARVLRRKVLSAAGLSRREATGKPAIFSKSR